MLLLHIDFKALNFLVNSQEVEIMRLLVKHLVQYRGSHTDDENKNILARNLMSLNAGSDLQQNACSDSPQPTQSLKATGDSDLELATFVMKSLQAKGKLDHVLLALISEIQEEMSFTALMGLLVKAKMDEDIFALCDYE